MYWWIYSWDRLVMVFICIYVAGNLTFPVVLSCIVWVAFNLKWQSCCHDSLCALPCTKVFKELELDAEAMSILLHTLIQWVFVLYSADIREVWAVGEARHSSHSLSSKSCMQWLCTQYVSSLSVHIGQNWCKSMLLTELGSNGSGSKRPAVIYFEIVICYKWQLYNDSYIKYCNNGGEKLSIYEAHVASSVIFASRYFPHLLKESHLMGWSEF